MSGNISVSSLTNYYNYCCTDSNSIEVHNHSNIALIQLVYALIDLLPVSIK